MRVRPGDDILDARFGTIESSDKCAAVVVKKSSKFAWNAQRSIRFSLCENSQIKRT